MSKAKVFISFDCDNDEALKAFLVGQSKSKDSPFDDRSIEEEITGDWKKQARIRIKEVDTVAVICGRNTDTATGVSAELEIAREENVPYFLLRGYMEGGCKAPKSANADDKIHDWTWNNLNILIGVGR